MADARDPAACKRKFEDAVQAVQDLIDRADSSLKTIAWLAVSQLTPPSQDSPPDYSEPDPGENWTRRGVQYLCVNPKMPHSIQLAVLFETYRHNTVDVHGWTVDAINESSSCVIGTARLKETDYNLCFAVDLDEGFRATATPMQDIPASRSDWGPLGYVQKFEATELELRVAVAKVLAFFAPPGRPPRVNHETPGELANYLTESMENSEGGADSQLTDVEVVRLPGTRGVIAFTPPQTQ